MLKLQHISCYLLLLLHIFIAAQITLKLNVEKTDDRIVGGVDASPGEFPHQVALLIVDPGRNLECGGTLISADLVITAGHCCHGLIQSRASTNMT